MGAAPIPTAGAACQLRGRLLSQLRIQLFSQPGALPKSALDDLLRQVRELDMDEVRKELAGATASSD